MDQNPKGDTHIHVHGEKAQINTGNQNNNTQNNAPVNHDHKEDQQVFETAKKAGYITRDEYDELILTLEELQEKDIKPAAKNIKIKRIRKGITGMIAKRVGKAVDTIQGSEIKKALGEKGLEPLWNWVKENAADLIS